MTGGLHRAAGGPQEIVGPYEEWVYGTGRHYALPTIRDVDSDLLSGLLEIPGGATLDELRKVRNLSRVWFPTLWEPGTPDCRYDFIPFVFRLPDKSVRSLGESGLVEELIGLGEDFSGCGFAPFADRQRIRPRYRINVPIAGEAFNADFCEPDHEPSDKVDTADTGDRGDQAPLVIVAVIDDGIPFAHRTLRDSKGRTRVHYCWYQSAHRPATSDAAGKTSPVLFGREFARTAIDGLIEAFGHDEDVLYNEAGASVHGPAFGPSLHHLTSHGSHVLDLAAGTRSGEDCDRVRIVAVQLPEAVTLDTSGFGKEAHILSAFHYVFERADRIARANGTDSLPLVINFSYGYTGGPHDGTDRLELAIRDLIVKRRSKAPTALVMPSGNTFLDALHGVIDEELFSKDRFDIPWRIQPDDRTSNYLEIWFPEIDAIGDFGIKVIDPSGREGFSRPSLDASGRDAAGSPVETAPIAFSDGRIIGQFAAERYQGRRWRLVIALAPTAPDDPALPATPPGLWTVALSRRPGTHLEGPIHCRIHRDIDVGIRHPIGARQSYFDDWRDKPFADDGSLAQSDPPTSFVKRFGSLNGIATHDKTTLTAGFVQHTGQPASYSSAGDLAAVSARVLCSATSERSSLNRGTRAAGMRSGAVFSQSGTSTAAPQVARALARCFLERSAGVLVAAAAGNYVSLLEGRKPPKKDRARLGMVMLGASDLRAPTEPGAPEA